MRTELRGTTLINTGLPMSSIGPKCIKMSGPVTNLIQDSLEYFGTSPYFTKVVEASSESNCCVNGCSANDRQN